jgi:type I restriction enzyme S subunit
LLYAVPENVAKLRQAILQLAVQGKLVPQDPNDEPARELLTRVEEDRLRVLQITGDRRARAIPHLDDGSDSSNSPAGWVWARLGNLALFVDYRGKTPPKSGAGIRLITAKNVRMGYIAPEPLEYVSETTYGQWMTRGFPRKGDVLFTTEAPLGNVSVLMTEEKVALAQRVIDFQLYSDISADYLALCLMSPPMQEALKKRATGMTAQGIKASKLKLVSVPIPPLPEQKRIVGRVNELMALCDDLETKLKQQRDHADRLAHAVLDTIVKMKAQDGNRLRSEVT